MLDEQHFCNAPSQTHEDDRSRSPARINARCFEHQRGRTCSTERTARAILLIFLLHFPIHAQSVSPNIIISQVYGGGGNSGATLRNDFVELFNRGSGRVNITGWTIQYASAAGSSWSRTDLSGSLDPGQYYLIQLHQGTGGSVSLPPSDAVGSINLSAMSGKLALVSNSDLLSSSSPIGPDIVDFVGYGSAGFAEGSPAPALTNTTAAIRNSGGCVDTGNNASDFTTGAPNPRNTGAPVNPCAGLVGPEISAAGVVNGASFLGGPVAPGEIISVFGSRMGPDFLEPLELSQDGQFVTKSLASTRVLFDGIASPLIFVRQDQLAAVVPYAVSGGATELQVEYEGRLSNKVVLPVAASSPGIFSLDASGAGQGAILNQDFSVNGPENPAAAGSVAIIFATGAGQTSPPGNDGKIIGTELPTPELPVSVTIGGINAEVLYAGGAPNLVSGVLQVNAEIPVDITPGPAVPVFVTVGERSSQPGITLAIGESGSPAGVGPLIEQKLNTLKSDPTAPVVPEIPTDWSLVPPGWLALVSWNIQVGGTSTSPAAERPQMVQAALSKLFTGTYQLLAAQEIPSSASTELLRTLLPGGAGTWQASFFDTTDTQDNGFWFTEGVLVNNALPLFVTAETDASGRIVTDPALSVHPPQAAHFTADDFDFMLITLHLTFAGGNTAESVRELKILLDYLDAYFAQPMHDPDVIICGDFNIPSLLSGQTGAGGITLDSVFDSDPRFQVGERRFAVTVHEPTSRRSAANGGTPANNYDHCVLSADTMEEFVAARRVDSSLLTGHPEDPEVRLTSDHFPIVGFFRTEGEGIARDLPH